MSTFIYQITSGSATAASDLGNILGAIRNDALVQINPTDLRWGFLSTDASGRLIVTGTLGVSASNLTANVTQGTTPWVVSGQVSATAHQDGIWGVTASAVTASCTNVPSYLSYADVNNGNDRGFTTFDVVDLDGSTNINLNTVGTYGWGTVNRRGHRWIAGSIRDASSYVASSTTGIVMMALATSAPLAYAGSAFRPFQMDLNGNLRITATAALPVSAGSVFGVSGNLSAVTASQNGVVWGVTASAVTASANVDGDTYAAGVTRGRTVFGLVSAASQAWAGSAMRPIRLSGDGSQYITASAIFPVSAGSVFGVSGNLSAVTASQNGVTWGVSASAATAMVSGQNAHNATTAGNPVRIGLVAAKMGAAPATAGDASGVNLYGTRYGQMFVLGGGPHVQFKEYDLTAATGFFQAVSGNTGEIIYVTEAGCFYDSNASANINFRLAFASAHNATGMDAAITATANTMLNNPIIRASALVPGGSVIRGNGGGIIASGADGCSILASCTAPGARRITFWFSYYVVSG